MSTLDFRDAQHVATELVAKALRAIFTDEIEHHGDWFRATHVHVPHKPDSIDGIVTFVIDDDTNGPAVNVTLMVSAAPIPSLRLAGDPTDPGSVIRAGVKR